MTASGMFEMYGTQFAPTLLTIHGRDWGVELNITAEDVHTFAEAGGFQHLPDDWAMRVDSPSDRGEEPYSITFEFFSPDYGAIAATVGLTTLKEYWAKARSAFVAQHDKLQSTASELIDEADCEADRLGIDTGTEAGAKFLESRLIENGYSAACSPLGILWTTQRVLDGLESDSSGVLRYLVNWMTTENRSGHVDASLQPPEAQAA